MKKLLVIIAVIVSILLVLFMASGCATPLTNTLDDVYRSAKVESDDSEVNISSDDVPVEVESDDGSEITVNVSDSLQPKPLMVQRFII